MFNPHFYLQADEKAIEDHFSQYGKVNEVSILRKKDGKMVGCAFVQYGTKKEALIAIKECNMKPLLGKYIKCDFNGIELHNFNTLHSEFLGSLFFMMFWQCYK